MSSSSALIRRGDLSLRRVDDRQLILLSGQNEILRFEKPRKSESEHINQSTCPHCHQLMPENLADELDSAYFRMLDSLKKPNKPQWENEDRPMLLGSPEDTPLKEKPGREGIAPLSLSQGYFDRFFKTKKLLGRGSRAAVYLVEHCLEGVVIGELALKKIPVGDDHAWLEKVLAEVTLLSSISHPNLVRYNHVWLEVSSLSNFCPPLPCAYVLQAYCNGGTLEEMVFKRQAKGSEEVPQTKEELLTQRRKRKDRQRSGQTEQTAEPGPVSLSDDEIYSFMRDILAGLAHLHDQGFLHCDLKPSNCLLQYHVGRALPSVLVSDFGESQREGSDRGGTGCTGTLEYTAPETLRPSNGKYVPFSRHSDMFSAGMILHFLCFSGLPYTTCWADETDLQRFRQEIQDFEFDYAGSIARFGKSAGLFEQLLCQLLGSADDRPDAREALAMLDRAKNAPVDKTEPLNQPEIYIARPPRSKLRQYLEENRLESHYYLSKALVLYLLHPSSIVVQCSIVLFAIELKFGPHLLFACLQLLVLGIEYL